MGWPHSRSRKDGRGRVRPPSDEPALRPSSESPGNGDRSNLPLAPEGSVARPVLAAQVADRLAGPAPSAGPRVVLLTGAAGLGKSVLALSLAHELTGGYPDGQVYLDCDGRDLGVDATACVTTLLAALGDRPAQAPSHREQRERLHALTEGRRILYVFDNVGPAARLGQLLPEAADSLVIVTARSTPADLTGVPSVEVGPLDVDEAHRVLVAAVRGAVPASTDDIETLVELAEGLPVALRICGRLLTMNPDWGAAGLVDHLLGAERRPDLFGATGHGLSTILWEGLGTVSEAGQEALGAVGLLGLTHVEPWMIAAVLDTDAATAHASLAELAAARYLDLVAEASHGDPQPGEPRFAVSARVRTFGARMWRSHGAMDSRAAVSRYVLELTSAVEALAEAAVSQGPGASAGSNPGRGSGPAHGFGHRSVGRLAAWSGSRSADRREPVQSPAQVSAQHPLDGTLVAAIELAERHGLVSECGRLTQLLAERILAERGAYEPQGETHEGTVAAVRAGGASTEESRLALGMAQLHLARESFAEAEHLLAEAERLAVEGHVDNVRHQVAVQRITLKAERHECAKAVAIADEWLLGAAAIPPRLRAEGLRQRGAAMRDLGELDEAERDITEAVGVYRGEGDRIGVALSLRGLSMARRARGDWAGAERYAVECEELFRSSGSRLFVQYAVQSVAKARIRTGVSAPNPLLAEARDVCAELNDDFGQALMLRTLGEEALALGDPVRARKRLEWALRMWADLELPGWKARTLRDLSTCAAQLGEHAEAARLRTFALQIFMQLGLREARELAEPDLR